MPSFYVARTELLFTLAEYTEVGSLSLIPLRLYAHEFKVYLRKAAACNNADDFETFLCPELISEQLSWEPFCERQNDDRYSKYWPDAYPYPFCVFFILPLFMGKFAVHCVCFSQRNVNGRSAEAAEARLISCRAKNSRGNVRRRMIDRVVSRRSDHSFSNEFMVLRVGGRQWCRAG